MWLSTISKTHCALYCCMRNAWQGVATVKKRINGILLLDENATYDAAQERLTLLFRHRLIGPRKSCRTPLHIWFNFSQAEPHIKVTQKSSLTPCNRFSFVLLPAAHLACGFPRGKVFHGTGVFQVEIRFRARKIIFLGSKLFTHRGWSHPKTPHWVVKIKSAE